MLDLDNLQRTIFNALERVAYEDDCQIVSVTAERYNIYGRLGMENLTPEEIEVLAQGVDIVSITVSSRE